MRIAIVSTLYPPEDGGGIATYCRHLAESLASQGHHVRIICRTQDQERVDHLNGVEVHRFRQRYLPLVENRFPGLAWSWFVRQTLIRWQNTSGLDAVEFSNWEGVGLMTSILPRQFPVITRLVTPYFESLNISATMELKSADRFICGMEQKAVQYSDRLITSTRHHAVMMAGNYHLDADAITVIPLGIELPPLPETPAPAPAKPELDVLYVSRLELRKGTLTLLEAIPRVLQQMPGVRFTFIGQDRPHAPGKRLFKEYFQQTWPEHTAQVKFLGFQPEATVEAAYASCDLFVVPSKYESFGLIYVEAMARGKPVIGCTSGGIPEVIKHPEAGLVIPPDDPEKLAQSILQLANDEGLREQMGKNARRWTEDKFDKAQMAANTLKAYQAAGSDR